MKITKKDLKIGSKVLVQKDFGYCEGVVTNISYSWIDIEKVKVKYSVPKFFGRIKTIEKWMDTCWISIIED